VGPQTKIESKDMKDPYNPSDDPQETIRADLWAEMNLSELTNQQDLVLTKLSLLASVMGSSPTQSYKDMYGSLQAALEALNGLIEHRTNNKPQQGQ